MHFHTFPNYYLPYDERTGLDSIYTHDSLKVTKKGAIYFPMGKELRNKERLATEAFLNNGFICVHKTDNAHQVKTRLFAVAVRHWNHNIFIDKILCEFFELANAEKIIKDNVENVYYLPYDERTGLDSIYTHDSLKELISSVRLVICFELREQLLIGIKLCR